VKVQSYGRRLFDTHRPVLRDNFHEPERGFPGIYMLLDVMNCEKADLMTVAELNELVRHKVKQREEGCNVTGCCLLTLL